jgi:class 3 adenylate cyclase
MLLFAASYRERVTALALFAPGHLLLEDARFPVRSDRRGRGALARSHRARLGDRRVREHHDRIVRAQIARRRGREIKTMGDGFLATFEGPARAVYCAQAIAEHVRPLGIEVRSGLHTGEVELDGDDIAGLGIAIGARVGAIAGPSQVLVSQTVKDLVAGRDCHSKTPACTTQGRT